MMVFFQVLALSTLLSCIWALVVPDLLAFDRRQEVYNAHDFHAARGMALISLFPIA